MLVFLGVISLIHGGCCSAVRNWMRSPISWINRQFLPASLPAGSEEFLLNSVGFWTSYATIDSSIYHRNTSALLGFCNLAVPPGLTQWCWALACGPCWPYKGLRCRCRSAWVLDSEVEVTVSLKTGPFWRRLDLSFWWEGLEDLLGSALVVDLQLISKWAVEAPQF